MTEKEKSHGKREFARKFHELWDLIRNAKQRLNDVSIESLLNLNTLRVR